MVRILYPDYRRENLDRLYPFDDQATLTNGRVAIPKDVFVDGRLYPIGADEHLYLLSIVVDPSTVLLTIADSGGPVGTASFPANDPPGVLSFEDEYERPIGILVCWEKNLAKLSGLANGTYTFLESQTRFAATICVPQPQAGVRALQIPTGEIFTGEVFLVGEDGVQLTCFQAPAGRTDLDHLSVEPNEIRVDIVGDPLFRRKICADQEHSYEYVRVAQTINGIRPDIEGNFQFTVGSHTTNIPALRLTPVENGLEISFLEDTNG